MSRVSIAQALEHPVTAQKTTDTSDKIRGSIKEAIGKLVGEPKVEAEGKSQQQLPKSDVKPKTTPES
ncbi:CsbD family protein [Methylobacterium trifolii]|uniref:CsbD family protein n=1 Tax=Methylobacterium trifolii TaxID=1003092 RepID=A0ABQ4TX16_9HYPH|nr:CsbD family protein [Methylobacterium trifolii]GJE59591.1 hypothetical protein MPOCJGCO_1687 [Methylobacterium trifolii]